MSYAAARFVDFPQQLYPGYNLIFPGQEFSAGLGIGRDAGFRCYVARSDVLFQGAANRIAHHSVIPARVASVLANCVSYSFSFWRSVSITLAGALFVNVSSESWRRELAITLSNCSFSF